MARRSEIRDDAEAEITIWKEALFGAELLLLHASPVFYGLGIPHGNGAGVVTIPGFLGSDFYLSHLQSWLGRIGYTPYVSGIPINAECPNLLIRNCLTEAIDKARKKTRRRVHLVGHSLGGVIARSVACQRPEDIASVITIASPFRGAVAHQSIRRIADSIRKLILKEHPKSVLPDCYTTRCTCEFLNSLRCEIPPTVTETAIYTCDDGIVDWRCCMTEDPGVDYEVSGTHVGLVFNASVYRVISDRLAYAESLQ
jgi:predicted alpha/beta hydrolase family esterase